MGEMDMALVIKNCGQVGEAAVLYVIPQITWKIAVTLSAMEREMMLWGREQGGTDPLASRDGGEI